MSNNKVHPVPADDFFGVDSIAGPANTHDVTSASGTKNKVHPLDDVVVTDISDDVHFNPENEASSNDDTIKNEVDPISNNGVKDLADDVNFENEVSSNDHVLPPMDDLVVIDLADDANSEKEVSSNGGMPPTSKGDEKDAILATDPAAVVDSENDVFSNARISVRTKPVSTNIIDSFIYNLCSQSPRTSGVPILLTRLHIICVCKVHEHLECQYY